MIDAVCKITIGNIYLPFHCSLVLPQVKHKRWYQGSSYFISQIVPIQGLLVATIAVDTGSVSVVVKSVEMVEVVIGVVSEKKIGITIRSIIYSTWGYLLHTLNWMGPDHVSQEKNTDIWLSSMTKAPHTNSKFNNRLTTQTRHQNLQIHNDCGPT